MYNKEDIIGALLMAVIVIAIILLSFHSCERECKNSSFREANPELCEVDE